MPGQTSASHFPPETSLFLTNQRRPSVEDLNHFLAVIKDNPQRLHEIVNRPTPRSALAACLIFEASPEQAKLIQEIIEFAVQYTLPKDTMFHLVSKIVLAMDQQMALLKSILATRQQWAFETIDDCDERVSIEKIPQEHIAIAHRAIARENQKESPSAQEIAKQNRIISWLTDLSDFFKTELPKYKEKSVRFIDSQARSSEDSPPSRASTVVLASSRSPSTEDEEENEHSRRARAIFYNADQIEELRKERAFKEYQLYTNALGAKTDIIDTLLDTVEKSISPPTPPAARAPQPPSPETKCKGTPSFFGLGKKESTARSQAAVTRNPR